jgi:LEA14-like dessication related protein
LKMDNSNPVPIPLSTIQFLARVEDRELAKGETTESLRLPALGSADASFKVLIPLRAIPGALDRGLVALFGEGLRYEIEGTAHLGGIFRIPFRKTGRFTRGQLLAALRA